MVVFGGLRTLWLVVMFDLPTDTAEARRRYTRFRKVLIENGFLMMQYSVYARHCASDENAEVHARRVKKRLPTDGEVRILRITDKQFGRIEVYFGRTPRPVESPPEQLSIF